MGYFIEILITVLLIVALVTLLINAINPRYMWKKLESWRATSEPSDTYFLLQRITSIIGVTILLVILLGPSLMYLLDK